MEHKRIALFTFCPERGHSGKERGGTVIYYNMGPEKELSLAGPVKMKCVNTKTMNNHKEPYSVSELDAKGTPLLLKLVWGLKKILVPGSKHLGYFHAFPGELCFTGAFVF